MTSFLQYSAAATGYPNAYSGLEDMAATAIHTDGIAELGTITAGTGGLTATFAGADVNTTDNKITIAGHPFSTGHCVRFIASSGNGGGINTQPSKYLEHRSFIHVSGDDIYFNQNSTNAATNTSPTDLTGTWTGTGHRLDRVVVYPDVALTTSGGGSGARAQITVVGTGVSEVIVHTPGKGYAVNDTVSCDSADIGNVTGFSAPISQIGVRISRTDGQVPIAVQISVCGVTVEGNIKNIDGSNSSTLSINAFQDAEVRTDFGDASGTEIFIHPRTGANVNANTDQYGPLATYVYRTSGDKTMRIFIRVKTASGDLRATITRTISPEASTRTRKYVDPSAGVNGNGDDPSTPYNGTSPTLTTLFRTSNRHISIRRGTTSTNVQLSILASTVDNVLVDAYDTGADPIIDTNTGGTAPLYIDGSSGAGANPKTNIHIQDLYFKVSGSSTLGACYMTGEVGYPGSIDKITVDNCTFETSAATGSRDQITFGGKRMVMWNCSVTGSLLTTISQLNCVSGACPDFLSIVGGSFYGGGRGVAADHVFYQFLRNDVLYRWTSIPAGSNPGRNAAFHARVGYGNGVPGLVAQRWLFADNDYHDLVVGVALTNAEAGGRGLGPVYYGLIANTIAQNNSVSATTSGAISITACKSATVRDNDFWSNTLGISNSSTSYDFYSGRNYRNRGYSTEAGSFRESLRYWGNGSDWVLPQIVTDNIWYHTQTAAHMVTYEDLPSFTAGGSVIGRNMFYAPADTDDGVIYDNTSYRTLSYMQDGGAGIEIDSQYFGGASDEPGWPNPGGGEFD